MKTAVYKEDDWIASVEILEDMSDDMFEKFRLRVIQTFQESRMFYPTPNNTIFTVDCRKDHLNMRPYIISHITDNKEGFINENNS